MGGEGAGPLSVSRSRRMARLSSPSSRFSASTWYEERTLGGGPIVEPIKFKGQLTLLVLWLRLAEDDVPPVWFSLFDKRLSFRVAMLPVVLGVPLPPCPVAGPEEPGVVTGCAAPAGPFPVAPVALADAAGVELAVVVAVPLKVALDGSVSLLKNISRLLCNC